MQKVELLNRIKKAGIVAVIRGNSASLAEKTADAVIKGGITGIELTFTVPHADHVITELTEKYADCKDVIIGAGTVLEPVSARIAIINGAKFIVSPSYNAEVAKMCNLYGIPYTPGCMTPTEVQHAFETGADLIKIFPGNVVTPKMISALKGPFPYSAIMPTGGINIDNMDIWFKSGVTVVGAGDNLTSAAAEGDFNSVTQMAKKYRDKLVKIRDY